MGCRGCTCVPLLFSVLTLVQGLFQIGTFVYFRYLSIASPYRLFSISYCPVWSGAFNFLASLSLIFLLSNGNDKKWRHRMRPWALTLFVSIAVVQSISWTLCEVLEFRLFLIVDEPNSSLVLDRLAWAYICSTSASIAGIIVGVCGFFYILQIYYRLENILFDDNDRDRTENVNRRTSNYRRNPRKRASTVAASAPAAVLAQRNSHQIATSWNFMRFRSSTPKAKTEKKKNRDSESSIKINRSGLEITKDDLSRSLPLRMIAVIKPDAFVIKNQLETSELVKSPSLENCSTPIDKKSINNNFDRSRNGDEMSSFFENPWNRRRVQNLINKESVEPPRPPPPTPATAKQQQRIFENKKPKFVLPETAWKLPSMPHRRQVAKVLNFSSDESKKDENGSGSGTNGDLKNETTDRTTFVVKHL
jgi:hypothetical protein